jgi:hypothetical protein
VVISFRSRRQRRQGRSIAVKRIILGLIAMAGAAAALPASAQTWGWGGDYGGGWNGDWGGRYAFNGYPEFRGEQAHIRSEIREGFDDGWLDEDQAREFHEHRWRLPDGDRAEIRADLHALDQAVDEARDQS